MQTKQKLISSPRVRQNFMKFFNKDLPATLCRGVTQNDMDFFYAPTEEYWADNCVGWLLDYPNQPVVCPFCKAHPPIDRSVKNNADDEAKGQVKAQTKSRNNSSAARPATKSSKPKSYRFRAFPNGR